MEVHYTNLASSCSSAPAVGAAERLALDRKLSKSFQNRRNRRHSPESVKLYPGQIVRALLHNRRRRICSKRRPRPRTLADYLTLPGSVILDVLGYPRLTTGRIPSITSSDE
jgi:hypothetical protein